MKKIILLLIISLILTSCSNTNIIPGNEPDTDNNNVADESGVNEKEAIMAPDFELKSLDGSMIQLSDLRDKNVILNFWATWCGFCIVEMPDLEKLQEAHTDDLLVLTVNVGESEEVVKKFVQENNLNLAVVLDEQMKVSNNYGVRSFPTSIAINKKGEAIGGYVGMLTYEQMEQLYSLFEE